MADLKQVLIQDFLIKGLIIAVIGGAITAYLNENLKLLRTSFLIASAKRKIKAEDPQTIMRGVNTLVQIAIDMPYRRQEMTDIIVNECLRKKFAQQVREKVTPTPQKMVEVFVDSLKAILNVPRENENRHRLNIDLHQIVLVAENGKDSIYLQNMDFRDVVLWGSDFVNVDFSRSNFENADLGGVRFESCGLEDLNLKNAKICYSFMDKRPTLLINSHAARSTIDEALIITGQNQLVIIGTEIDPERRNRLMQRSEQAQQMTRLPMVSFDQMPPPVGP